jgi:hypothetical protein
MSIVILKCHSSFISTFSIHIHIHMLHTIIKRSSQRFKQITDKFPKIALWHSKLIRIRVQNVILPCFTARNRGVYTKKLLNKISKSLLYHSYLNMQKNLNFSWLKYLMYSNYMKYAWLIFYVHPFSIMCSHCLVFPFEFVYACMNYTLILPHGLSWIII